MEMLLHSFSCNLNKLRYFECLIIFIIYRYIAEKVSQRALCIAVKLFEFRFAKEYFARPDRGYGSNIPAVFHELKETKYKDPFGPASRQFNGSGSYGNGGAMRIAPAALFGLKLNDTEFNVCA